MRVLKYFFFILIFHLQFGAEATSYLSTYSPESYREVVSENRRVGKIESNWKQISSSQIQFSEKSVMKITLFGKPQEIETNVQVITDPNLQIQSFEYEMKSPDSQMKVSGRRQDSKMILKKIQAGKEQIKEILIQEPLLFLPLIRPYLLKEGLLKLNGSMQRSALLLEPAALTIIPVSLEVQSTSKGYLVKTVYLSQSLEAQLDKNGQLIEERTDFAGLPMVERIIEKNQYTKTALTGTQADLVERVKVPFPKIANPREIESLEIQIDGIPFHNFELNRHRQSLNANRLRIVKEKKIESAPVQSLVGRTEFDKYLTGDVSVPVFDPLIQRKAREIVGNENDLWKRAKKIHEFVYKHLEKDPYVSLPDALEALQSGRGDCNEHAVLYTALARAAGVPTRTLVGLVYSDSFYGGGQPGFYYHAWVEVFTGKTWVSIDPTWNQIPSDVTHIAFVEGGADQQIQIAGLMGKIRLSPVNAAVRVR